MKPYKDAPPFYLNATSIIHGQWTRSKLERSVIRSVVNLSIVAPEVHYISNKYRRNITGHTGDLRIQIDEIDEDRHAPESSIARGVKAAVTIQDETSTGDGWEVDLHGVHYPQIGSLLLSTTSSKFAGIFALPHFALSRRAFTLSQLVLNLTLAETLRRQGIDFEGDLNPRASSESSDTVFPTPQCELVVYLQQHPTAGSALDMVALERELRFPTGARMPTIPPIKFSSLIFSPDCGFILESIGPPDFSPQEGLHLNGKKLEAFTNDARRYILAFIALLCAQMLLWSRQVKDASTPSTKSRISFYTVGLMVMGDCLTLYLSIFLAMYTLFKEVVFLPLITTAFFSYLCVNYLGMDFMVEISAVQVPEREHQRLQEQEQPGASSTVTALNASPTARLTAAGVDTLPLPVTAGRPADVPSAPVSVPPDQEIDATAIGEAFTQTTRQPNIGSAGFERLNFSAKFYLLCFGLVCLFLFISTRSLTFRSSFSNGLAFMYFSFWTPQIKRNISRNCRRALRWDFVVGQSVLRLIPVIYFYTVPNNILYIYNDFNAAYVLIGWVWFQICTLVSQAVLGPRFFVPAGWAPPAYDYHPILREEDEEAGASVPIGYSQAIVATTSKVIAKPGESKEEGKKVFDCAICTENIEVSVIPSSGSRDGDKASVVTPTTIFSRIAYMVTPCRHIFHTQCLESWMKYRLQCPICRKSLPPL